jgi:hypothetical protein
MDSYPELLQYHGRKLAILEYSHEDVHSMVVSYALEGTDPFQVSLHKLQHTEHHMRKCHMAGEQRLQPPWMGILFTSRKVCSASPCALALTGRRRGKE